MRKKKKKDVYIFYKKKRKKDKKNLIKSCYTLNTIEIHKRNLFLNNFLSPSLIMQKSNCETVPETSLVPNSAESKDNCLLFTLRII